jgi:hypothetical protein
VAWGRKVGEWRHGEGRRGGEGERQQSWRKKAGVPPPTTSRSAARTQLESVAAALATGIRTGRAGLAVGVTVAIFTALARDACVLGRAARPQWILRTAHGERSIAEQAVGRRRAGVGIDDTLHEASSPSRSRARRSGPPGQCRSPSASRLQAAARARAWRRLLRCRTSRHPLRRPGRARFFEAVARERFFEVIAGAVLFGASDGVELLARLVGVHVDQLGRAALGPSQASSADEECHRPRSLHIRGSPRRRGPRQPTNPCSRGRPTRVVDGTLRGTTTCCALRKMTPITRPRTFTIQTRSSEVVRRSASSSSGNSPTKTESIPAATCTTHATGRPIG